MSLYDSIEDIARIYYNNGGGVLSKNTMNKKVQELIKGITKDIIAYLMQDNKMDLP